VDNADWGMSEYDDPRAHALREEYHAVFGGAELPVPVHAIAEDLLGLAVEERALDGASGYLFPAERRIVLNAREPETRRRFTLAHELGHWVCQCLEGTTQAVYCRAEEVGMEPEAKALEREANIFAANLVMPEEAVRSAGGENRFGVSDEALAWRHYNLGLREDSPS